MEYRSIGVSDAYLAASFAMPRAPRVKYHECGTFPVLIMSYRSAFVLFKNRFRSISHYTPHGGRILLCEDCWVFTPHLRNVVLNLDPECLLEVVAQKGSPCDIIRGFHAFPQV
jgi:hypothetical protein